MTVKSHRVFLHILIKLTDKSAFIELTALYHKSFNISAIFVSHNDSYRIFMTL